jgi:signal peptidase I
MHFIKRIIGFPGDEIELRGMELYVNGKKWTAQGVPQLERRLLK